jgi:phosphonate transport system ATP-binding protein
MTIEINGLSKTFKGGFQALDGIDLSFAAGEMVALIGASGSGKSTLLRHISGLMPGNSTSSLIKVGGRVVQYNGAIDRHVRAVRADIGFIFQQFNLVGRLPVLTNVLSGGLARMPLWRSCIKQFTGEEKALGLEALARVGIVDHAYKRASALSGGQQQRAAIARTIVQKAKIILADEPIASLDPESARRVMQTLSDLNRQDGTTVLVSLHQVDMAIRFCPRTVALNRGRVVYDGPSNALTAAMLRELYGAEADDILSTSSIAAAQPSVPVAGEFHALPAFAAAAA